MDNINEKELEEVAGGGFVPIEIDGLDFPVEIETIDFYEAYPEIG